MCITRSTNKTELVRLFSLGQVVATPGALEAMDQYAINALDQHGEYKFFLLTGRPVYNGMPLCRILMRFR